MCLALKNKDFVSIKAEEPKTFQKLAPISTKPCHQSLMQLANPSCEQVPLKWHFTSKNVIVCEIKSVLKVVG